jgi:hypothetical protein
MWPKKRIKKKWQVIPKVRSSGKSGRHDGKSEEKRSGAKKI